MYNHFPFTTTLTYPILIIMPRKKRGSTSNTSAEKSSLQEEENIGESTSIPQEGAINNVDTSNSSESTSEKKKFTMDERMEKMRELRKKMADSSKANRKAVATELNQSKQNSQIHQQKMKQSTSRKLERAERLLDERDAVERGEDYERIQSWNYTIEDNERWEEKLKEKEAKKDQGYLDAQSASERTYNRLIGQIKPGNGPSSNGTSTQGSSSALILNNKEQSQINEKDLQYGTHKPDDAALDRVTAHLNAEADVRAKRSRNRADDPDADVDYINNKNKHYNKKIKRFFDQHTREIRDSFERGTAL